ncbi:MAG: hypothetical protein NVSMB10_11580 [Steroidobacteraceae bacterium]
MTALEFSRTAPRARLGIKGPGAERWLGALGIEVPPSPNSWVGEAGVDAEDLLVARLGTAEFFLEGASRGSRLSRILAAARAYPPGVYPVLREDAAFSLSGDRCLDVLAQTCNVNFADLALEARPIVLTLMIGVSVLIVPCTAAGRAEYRIWCDPTFGSYLEESLGGVVVESGGQHRGVAA